MLIFTALSIIIQSADLRGCKGTTSFHIEMTKNLQPNLQVF